MERRVLAVTGAAVVTGSALAAVPVASAEPPGVRVPPGYEMRAVARNLDFPTGSRSGRGKPG
jgi:hypothetical protein